MSSDGDDADEATASSEGGLRAPNGDDEVGSRGWVLVGALVLGTLVVPAIIYLYPPVLADHVPFTVAMLALPFVPAVLLGALAVWAMAGRVGPG